jgi:hypothetical protein
VRRLPFRERRIDTVARRGRDLICLAGFKTGIYKLLTLQVIARSLMRYHLNVAAT